ncbi:hypothetical protein GCM10009850_097080 [Nonomuraea monospora]|uniref:Uncharacterized protein n=1 Tax=Nonomuraea monospora TaxID=568818 RepID=A0ABP5PRI6_9ACTN
MPRDQNATAAVRDRRRSRLARRGREKAARCFYGLRFGRGAAVPRATPAEAVPLKLDQSTHIASWVDWKTHVPPPGEV